MIPAGHVARTGDEGIAYKILLRSLETKKPFGRPRHRKKDNIRMYLRETGCEI
jgi:hypothetical protein